MTQSSASLNIDNKNKNIIIEIVFVLLPISQLDINPR